MARCPEAGPARQAGSHGCSGLGGRSPCPHCTGKQAGLSGPHSTEGLARASQRCPHQLPGSATVQALSGQRGPPIPALGLCPLPGLLPQQARCLEPSLPTGTSATSKRRGTDRRLPCSHAYTVLHPAAPWLAGAGGGAETPRLAEGRGSTPRFSRSFLTYKAPRCIHSRLSFWDSQSQAGTPAAAHWH